LVPLVLAKPLSVQFGRSDIEHGSRGIAGIVAVMLATALAIWVFTARHAFTPMVVQTPAAAVDVLKQHKAERILHNAGFGGYLITRGIPVFFDGRGELYGDDFLVRTFDALALKNVGSFLGLLETYRIDATLLTPDTPAAGLLDRLDGWQRIYADEVAVVHIRKPGGGADSRLKPADGARQ
jgi:hypothetical protein